MKNKLYFLSTIILFLFLFTGLAFPQTCKYCAISGGAYHCAPVNQNNRTGGCACAGGDTCILGNPCTTTIGCIGEKAGSKQTLINFDEKTINEISVRFPRLAVALIALNNRGGFKNDVSIFTPAVDIYSYEVSNWVASPGKIPQSKQTYFEELRKRIDDKKESAIISFSIQKGKGANFTLKALVTQEFSNDPKYTGAIFKINKNKVTGWELTDSNE